MTKTQLKKIALAALSAFAVVLMGAGGLAGHDSANAQTSGVSIRRFAFDPATVKIRVGEQVRWINDEDNIPHTVVSENYGGPLLSTLMRPGDSYFSPIFSQAGAYQYLCTIHPRMRGVVLVGDATGAPGVPSPAGPRAPIMATLSGREEVPAQPNSIATGMFSATPGRDRLEWQLLAGGVGFVAGHIHLGAAGVNGPIVVPLIANNPGGQNTVDTAGTVAQSDLVGPLAGNYAGFAAALARGELYVNLHTVAFPGGEIRAQLRPAAPGPPNTGSVQASHDDQLQTALLAAGAALAAGACAAVVAHRRRRVAESV